MLLSGVVEYGRRVLAFVLQLTRRGGIVTRLSARNRTPTNAAFGMLGIPTLEHVQRVRHVTHTYTHKHAAFFLNDDDDDGDGNDYGP